MNEQLLNRREFNGLWVTLGSSLSSAGTMIVALSSASARDATRTVMLHDGTILRRSAKAQRAWGREDVRKPLRKTRCAQAFRSG